MSDIQFVYQDGSIKHTIYIPVSTIMISSETLIKTLKEIHDTRARPEQVIVIEATPSSRLVICDDKRPTIYVDDSAISSGAFSFGVMRMTLPDRFTVEQCARIAEALTELARNPLAVCSVINEFLKPGSVSDDERPIDPFKASARMALELCDNCDNEEPVPPTVRTGNSHGE